MNDIAYLYNSKYLSVNSSSSTEELRLFSFFEELSLAKASLDPLLEEIIEAKKSLAIFERLIEQNRKTADQPISLILDKQQYALYLHHRNSLKESAQELREALNANADFASKITKIIEAVQKASSINPIAWDQLWSVLESVCSEDQLQAINQQCGNSHNKILQKESSVNREDSLLKMLESVPRVMLEQEQQALLIMKETNE
jgi:hypothetical protein